MAKKQALSDQVAAMEKRILKVDGTPRAGTTPEQIEQLETLREQLFTESRRQRKEQERADAPDDEQATTAELADSDGVVDDETLAEPDEEADAVDPDLARNTPEGYDLGPGPVQFANPTRNIAINVNGQTRTRRVPVTS